MSFGKGAWWGLLILLLSCSAPRPPEPLASPSRIEPDPDFVQARKALEASDNWCFGQAQLATLEAELKERGLAPQRRCEALVELSGHQLRLGQEQQALASIDAAITLAEQNPALAERLKPLRLRRAIVWLRIGELANCIDGHCQASCIFPLSQGGVHQNKAAAEAALEDLLAVVEGGTQRPAATELWLLNLVAMQLGRYPQAVPESLRLPQKLWPTPLDPTKHFLDVAQSAGIGVRDMCGGVVAEDLDGDGLLDIVSSSASYVESVRFYRNRGDGGFEDRTESAGLLPQTGAFNVRAADYDNDGDIDLFLVRGAFLRDLGRVRRSLLQNDGHGRFVDVTRAAGLAEAAYPSGTAAWGDFDSDGHLDLFVANETTDPVAEPYPCQLFHNNGDGTFTDIAPQAGVDAALYAKGVAVGDFDNDGWQDLFITDFSHRDHPHPVRRGNLLFRNQGNGRFVEVTSRMGIEGPETRAFSCWFFDYDNDGWLDLFVAGYEAQLIREVRPYLGYKPYAGQTRLYRNEGGRRFVDVSKQVGLTGVWSIMGSSFGDIDFDGYLDMYFGTGAPMFEYLTPNIMLQNMAGQSFQNVTFERGVGHLQKGHGAVFADFDQDGDQDLYAQLGGTWPADSYYNALFANPGALTSTGQASRFLYIELESRRPVLGARIKVELDNPGGPAELHRAVGFVSSFGYTPYRQEIGLGQARAVRAVEVSWPSGHRQRFAAPPVSSLIRLTEGKPGIQKLAMRGFRLAEAAHQTH